MKPDTAGLALAHLRHFLKARGWKVGQVGERFEHFLPPRQLDLPGDYHLTVPTASGAPDLADFLTRLIAAVSDLYACSPDQIEPVVEYADTVLSLHFDDQTGSPGTIGLQTLEEMLDGLKGVLLQTAAFAISDDPVADRVPPEARWYLEQCRFLPTGKGSFVANVQLPSQVVLREESLLSGLLVNGTEVTRRVAGLMDLVTGSVLAGDARVFTDSHFDSHVDLLSLDVLRELEAVLHAGAEHALDLDFIDLDHSRRVVRGSFSPEKKARFESYVGFVRKKLGEEVTLNVEGKIVELRSRNPDADRNYVLLKSVLESGPRYVGITLSNELYGLALQAHSENKLVRVLGTARRLKTLVKITELRVFEPIPPGRSPVVAT